MRRAVLPLEEAAVQAAKATTIHDITSLYRPGDDERRDIVFANMDPEALGAEAIRTLTTASNRRQRRGLLTNPRLKGLSLDVMVAASFRLVEDPADVYAWVCELLYLRPDARGQVRQLLWDLVQDPDMAGSIKHDLSLGLLRYDVDLSAEQIMTLFDRFPFEGIVRAAVDHPNADTAVWVRALDFEGPPSPGHTHPLYAAVLSRARHDPAVRAVGLQRASLSAARGLAYDASPEEACILLERARDEEAPEAELEILADLPAEAITADVRALALQSPFPETRLAVITRLSSTEPAKAKPEPPRREEPRR